MYISRVRATNFRRYGESAAGDDPALDLALLPGLNCLIGENDSGKTTIVDAIRICLGTTTHEYQRLTADDFHCLTDRATSFEIQCRFSDLSPDELASFLEFITTEDTKQVLWITLRAERGDGNRISTTLKSGPAGDGPSIDGVAREVLRVTYLRPLRDAEAELRSGRNSRLSQILANHQLLVGQDVDDFDAKTGNASTLVGVFKRAEHAVGMNAAIKSVRDDLNTTYLEKLAVGTTAFTGEVAIASDSTLERILEKLELKIGQEQNRTEWTRRGLGYNNALFMAAEMLLLGKHEASGMLIEEPEAHLHPQLLLRVIELLEQNSLQNQIIVTTHSPIFASSIPVQSLTIVSQGKTFWLGEGATRLEESDYKFLARFLDSTKSNMFFARGVAIVEGDAEAILLPALASAVDKSLAELGVSIVNVGHTGLFRYARVFQRVTGDPIPIKVACLRDRDLAPDTADAEMTKKLKRPKDFSKVELLARVAGLSSGDGGPVKTFVSDEWTFEYDLAKAGWKLAGIMHRAVSVAKLCANVWPSQDKIDDARKTADKEISSWKISSPTSPSESVALEIYRPLRLSDASKTIAAQFAASDPEISTLNFTDLPKYLRDALDYLSAK